MDSWNWQNLRKKTLRQRKRLLLRNLRHQPNLRRQKHRRKRLNRKKQNKHKNLKKFDFDKFINRPCIGEGLVEGIFGRKALYIPDNKEFQPFDILVDFHKGYQEVKLKTAESPVTSTEIAAFITLCEMPENSPKILHGDHLHVETQIFDLTHVEYHIPGTDKAVLHEQCAATPLYYP